MKQTYFTIEPTVAGFTDQLIQFNAFYKLGLSLGFRYIHRPFSSERSNASYLLVGEAPRDISTGSTIAKWLKRALARRRPAAPDVFDFLGVNQVLQARSQPNPADLGSLRSLTIALSDKLLLDWNIDSFEALAAHVGDLATQFASDPDADPASATVINFRLDGPRRNCFSLIQAKFPGFQDGLDLPRTYSEARARAPIKSLYPKRGLKLLVHIRQGDTGVVETPWKTYMPVWSLRKDQLKEYDSFEQIESAELLFEVSEFKAFLDGLMQRLGTSGRSLLVFSDGANRGLRIVERSVGKLGWSQEKIESFKKSRADYDRRQFACFSASPDVRLVVGEEPEKLRQLINSAIESDIVIVSNQLRMIPKLVANFCNGNAPKVIVLYKHNRPVNSDIIDNDEQRFIYVDIRNPDYDALLRRLQE